MSQNLVYKIKKMAEDAGMHLTIDLTTLSANQLRRAADLLEKRDKLVQELNEIFGGPDNGVAQILPRIPRKRKALKISSGSGVKFRSRTTRKVYQALVDAGSKGMKVLAICRSTKLKPQRVHAFLSKNVGNIPGLSRLSPGHYAIKAA